MSVKDTFTATGTSEEVVGTRCDFILTGTFDATVEAQVRDINGEWAVPSDSTAVMTSEDAITIECALPRPMRLECTVYTSGTVTYSIEGLTEQTNYTPSFIDRAGDIRD